MSMHQEARRRQMHMDRVCEARRRMVLAQTNGQISRMLAGSSATNMETGVNVWADQAPPFQKMKQFDNKENLEKVLSLRPWKEKTELKPPITSCPPVFQSIKRDDIYKVLHPHSEC